MAHTRKLALPSLRLPRTYIFWLLVSFLVFVFLTGGGSRHDSQSLVLLRPLAVIVCGIALATLSADHLRTHRTIFLLAAGAFLLALSHIVPLPPSLWHLLAGRELLIEVDRAAGIGDAWRPMAMVPALAWNALYSLFVPLAVLLLGVQLAPEERLRLMPVILGLCLFSGLWGLMQIVGAPDGPLYLHRHTTPGAAVGLFANRNHQAALLSCLFPILATFASFGARSEEQAKVKFWLAIAGGAFLVPLIIVTGSRAGLMTGVVGLGFAFWLYQKPKLAVPAKRAVRRFNPRLLLAAMAILIVVALTVIMARAEAFRRLLAADQTEDLRLQMWNPIADMALKYAPFGSGLGSFVQVYQIDEPAALLGLSYVNHAHNDWLEIWLTAGVPGVLLIALAVFAYLRRSYAAFTGSLRDMRSAAYARLGAAIIFIFALASVVDYPLRVPSIACLCVVAMLWLNGKATPEPEKAGRRDVL